MVIDPATAIIISSAVNAAAQGGLGALGASRERKIAKKKSKEMQRETYGDLYNEAALREQQLAEQRLRSNARLGQRRSQTMNDTASLLREAFGI